VVGRGGPRGEVWGPSRRHFEFWSGKSDFVLRYPDIYRFEVVADKLIGEITICGRGGLYIEHFLKLLSINE
jgi:hypothetical protein